MFIRNGLILGLSNIFIGLINYAYQIIMVNKMQPLEFKAASLILSSYAILGTILTTYTYWGQKSKLYIQRGFLDLYVITLILPCIIIYYYATNNLVLLTVIIALLCANFPVVNIGIKLLNDEKYFISSLTNFIGSAVKLVIVIVFTNIFILFDIELFYLSFVFGSLCAYIFARNFEEKNVKHKFTKTPFKNILVSNLATNLYLNFDVLLVSIYYDADIVVSYVIASTISKAIIHFMSGFTFLIFKSGYDSVFNNEFIKKLVIGLILSLICCSILYFIGDFLIDLLYKSGNAYAKEILPFYLLTIIPVFIIQIVEHVFMSNGKTIGTYIFIVSAILELVFISYMHTNVITFLLFTLFIKVTGSILILLTCKINHAYEKNQI